MPLSLNSLGFCLDGTHFLTAWPGQALAEYAFDIYDLAEYAFENMISTRIW